MPQSRSLDIYNKVDFKLVEILLKKYKIFKKN